MDSLKLLFDDILNDYKRKYNHELKIYSTSSLSGGCVNSAAQLETNIGRLFLKWNNSGANDLFEQEAYSLNELNKFENEFLSFPKPLLWKKITANPGYLLTTFIEKGHNDKSEENLGRGVATLHLNSTNSFGFHHNNYCGDTLQNNYPKSNWLQFYKENRLVFLIKKIWKKLGWSTDEEKTIEKFLNKLDTLIPNDSIPSLVHGDLWMGNYLYTNNKPALIDPCVSYSDYEFEFGIMLLFGGFSEKFFKAYNEINLIRPDWLQRNNIYQLYHLLNHYYMFGGSYRYQSIEIMKSYL